MAGKGIAKMRAFLVIIVVASFFGLLGSAVAAEPAEDGLTSLLERETLTNNLFGLGDRLSDSGVTVSRGLTQIYQVNLQGGMSTHRHSGHYAGSYDLELEFDLERILQGDLTTRANFSAATSIDTAHRSKAELNGLPILID